AGQVLVAEVLAAQATLGGTGLRTQVLRLDQRGGGRVVATLDQVDATRVHHVDARRRLADAAQDGHRIGRGAVVVAQQGHGVVGGGADHGQAADVLRQR